MLQKYCNTPKERYMEEHVACSLFRGFQCIEVCGEIVETFRIACCTVDLHCWGVTINQGSIVKLWQASE